MFGQVRGQLVVRARSTSANVQTNNISFILQVVNDQGAATDLRDLELRYWYKPGQLGKATQQVDIDYAAVGAANIKTDITPPDANGLAVLRVRFSDTAGAIKPYTSSGDITVRIHKSDWTNYDQRGDFSFKPDNTLSDWDHVALYQGGQLVWGLEPEPPTAAAGR